MTVQYQGVWSLQSAAQLQSTQRWVTDPVFDYTTLLLQADDAANGSQNNTFLDSSSNSFAITRNGNTTQGSFTPFSLQPGAWSFYGGSASNNNVGIYLNGESDFAFGTGDFTIEMWVNLASKSPGQIIYDSRPDGTQGLYPAIYVDGSTNKLKFFVNNTDRITQNSTFTYNAWHHVVVTRTGTNTKMFVNGIQEGSTYTDSNNYINGALRPFTGDGVTPTPSSNSYGITGYISNLRVVKGSGPYQSAGSSITVPTSPLIPVTNTVLLTAQSNRFVDTNTQVSAKTINTFNSPTIQPFSPFAPQFQWTPSVIGGSGYFDGTGDFLQTPATGQFAPTGNWTISLWFYPTALASTQDLIGNYTANTGADWTWVVNSNGSIDFYLAGASVITMSAAAGTIRLNQWHFISVSRSTNTVTAFVNGSQVATASYSQTLGSASKAQYVGSRFGSFVCTGYISDVRMVDGQVVTSVPTTPTTTTTGSVTASNTKLLLNFTNAGIFDGTMKNNLETVGNAQVSTAVVKYGSGSMYFDGTGDYLSLPVQRTIELGSADWTFETWVYMNAVSSQQSIIYLNGNTSGYAALNLQVQSGALNLWLSANGSSWSLQQNTIGTIAANAWNHIAVVKVGTNIKVYINGTNVSGNGYTVAASLMTTYTVNQIGVYNASSYNLNGYLDDMRLTLGIARYTQNFIPPSVALPRQ